MIAALALMAGLGAASASAGSDFTSEAEETTLQGTAITTHIFTLGGGLQVKCGGNFEGEMTTPSESVQVAPNYLDCDITTTIGTWTATVTTNGCELVYHSAGSFDVAGTDCKGIKITYPLCTVTIPAQTGVESVAYQNEQDEPGSLRRIKIDNSVISDLEYNQTANCHGGGGTFANGDYVGDWQLKGESLWNEQVGIVLVKQPQFEAESYPVTVAGQQAGENGFSFATPHEEIRCEEAALSGELTAASPVLSLTGAFGDCAAFVGENTLTGFVDMRSCQFVVNAAKVDPFSPVSYPETLDIACGTQGDYIQFTRPLCHYRLPAQAGLTGVTLTNSGSGSGRQVSIGIQASSVSYTQTSTYCTGGKLTASDGELSGTFAMKASNGSPVGFFVKGAEF